MKKLLATLLVGLELAISCLSGSAFAFEFKLDGWKEFEFGENWSEAKTKIEVRCLRLESYGNDIMGRDCGKWLQLDIDARIIADEGTFLGFGKKLDVIEVSTMFSDFATNKILNHLRSNFELTRDYKCWSKQKETHHCSIIFNNGAVEFEDILRFGKRRISVSLRPYELYRPNAFK